jgi:chromosome segregation ATPase
MLDGPHREILEGVLFGMNGRNCSPNHYAHVRRTLRKVLGHAPRTCTKGHDIDANGWCYYCRESTVAAKTTLPETEVTMTQDEMETALSNLRQQLDAQAHHINRWIAEEEEVEEEEEAEDGGEEEAEEEVEDEESEDEESGAKLSPRVRKLFAELADGVENLDVDELKTAADSMDVSEVRDQAEEARQAAENAASNADDLENNASTCSSEADSLASAVEEIQGKFEELKELLGPLLEDDEDEEPEAE